MPDRPQGLPANDNRPQRPDSPTRQAVQSLPLVGRIREDGVVVYTRAPPARLL